MTTAWLFPGQGAQRPGMLDPWLADPRAAAVLAEAADETGLDLLALSRDPDALGSTAVVQPVLLAAELAGMAVMDGAPAVTAGHSLGEYAALVAAGALSVAGACRIVAVRGRAMDDAARATDGTMTAVMGLSIDDVAAIADKAGAVVANENSATQVVLAGAVDAVERAEDLVRTAGGRPTRLSVAGAFHSPLMASAVPALAAAIAEAELHEPRCPLIANVTGRATSDPEEIRALLARHIVEPVRWAATMDELARLGVDHLVEIGPGRVLTGLAKRALPDISRENVDSPRDGLDEGAT